MREVSIEAYAKVNLTLDITGKRADGYHTLRSVMQSIDLHDTLRIREAASGVRLSLSFADGGERGFDLVPADMRNIACRAAERLLREAGIAKGVEIDLYKRIPAAAGLAGGSTDAAAVLKGINALYELGWTIEALSELGATLGADVPFCIRGGTALAEGIGERLRALPAPRDIAVLLAKPPVNVSTAEAYRAYDGLAQNARPVVDTDGMVKRLERGEGTAAGLARYLGNVLAAVTEAQHDGIVQLREAMVAAGAAGAMMSGSGPSVFGLYETPVAAEAARARLCETFPGVYFAVTSFHGA